MSGSDERRNLERAREEPFVEDVQKHVHAQIPESQRRLVTMMITLLHIWIIFQTSSF